MLEFSSAGGTSLSTFAMLSSEILAVEIEFSSSSWFFLASLALEFESSVSGSSSSSLRSESSSSSLSSILSTLSMS